MSAKIIVVEDEPIIAADLQIILQRLGYNVLEAFDNAEEALPFIIEKQPELVLLDIALSGNMDGLALAELLKLRTSVSFIFITSYTDKDTLEKVQRLEPAAFIVKPFQEKNLAVNIELALSYRKRVKGISTKSDISIEKVFVKHNNELLALDFEKITHIEAADNYAYVFSETQKYLLSHTLKSIEEKLSGLGFVRVHKSFLINARHIASIQDGYIFIGVVKVPVGKSYKSELMNAIKIL